MSTTSRTTGEEHTNKRNAHGLTPAEMDILRKACQGLTNKEIAQSRNCKLESIRGQVNALKILIFPDDLDHTNEELIAYANEHVLPHYPEEGSP